MSRKIRTVLLLAALLLVAFFLPVHFSDSFKALVRDMFTPFFSFAARASDADSYIFSGRVRLASENKRLADKVEELQAQMVLMSFLENDNLMLRRQLGFHSRYRGRLLPCEVIGRDFSGWWSTIVINRGSAHGLEKGLPVISSSGLIGRIISVSSYSSEVLLITDHGSRVSVMFQQSGVYGLMSGRGVTVSGGIVCRVEFVSKDMTVEPGAQVVTSGLGGRYPRGVPVGTVKAARRDRSDLFQYVDIVPSADLPDLSYVFVVLSDDDWIGERVLHKSAGLVGGQY